MIKSNDVIDILEKRVDSMLRDEKVIKLISFNINSALKIQKFTHEKFETFLKLADIPTHKNLSELFETVSFLEKENRIQKERIELLEQELAKKKVKSKKVI